MGKTKVVQQVGSQTCTLKTKHDFNWLEQMGDVFAVFDQQDSGNISFGVQTSVGRKFVKYAGAETLYYEGERNDAIKRLNESVTVYKDLTHPTLVHLNQHFETAHGYALVFDWVEGECLHSHWSFPPPEKYTHSDSPFYKFKQLPIEKRIEVLTAIFDFHKHVERQGYVAIDFYDGSILYDFLTNTTTICDIDVYSKKHISMKWGGCGDPHGLCRLKSL